MANAVLLSVVILSVVMLSFIMLNVAMPNVAMLSVVMLSVIMLSVNMLSVIVPRSWAMFYVSLGQYSQNVLRTSYDQYFSRGALLLK